MLSENVCKQLRKTVNLPFLPSRSRIIIIIEQGLTLIALPPGNGTFLLCPMLSACFFK